MCVCVCVLVQQTNDVDHMYLAFSFFRWLSSMTMTKVSFLSCLPIMHAYFIITVSIAHFVFTIFTKKKLVHFRSPANPPKFACFSRKTYYFISNKPLLGFASVSFCFQLNPDHNSHPLRSFKVEKVHLRPSTNLGPFVRLRDDRKNLSTFWFNTLFDRACCSYLNCFLLQLVFTTRLACLF